MRRLHPAGEVSRLWRLVGAVVLVWAALAGPAPAATLDDQVYAIARQLMCPVCVGQTVAESDSQLAREMRALIRQKLQAGETPAQIIRYFVGEFGDGVLAEPHPGGFSLILYAAPPLALIAGGLIAVAFIRRSRGRGRVPGDPEGQTEPGAGGDAADEVAPGAAGAAVPNGGAAGARDSEP